MLADSLSLLPVPLALVDLGMLLLKLLAVAGGAVLGGACAGMVARWLARSTFWKQPPQSLVFASRIAGFGAAGFLVWLWAFGTGGSGLGFGSGGLGSGGSKYVGYDSPEKESKEAADHETAQKGPPGKTAATTARIEMLGGGRVQQDRFYLLDGQTQPLTLVELEKTLLARKTQETNPLKVIEIVIFEDSVDKDHPAVRDLDQWAERNGLQVTVSFPQGKRP